jgi:hypothetical protein
MRSLQRTVAQVSTDWGEGVRRRAVVRRGAVVAAVVATVLALAGCQADAPVVAETDAPADGEVAGLSKFFDEKSTFKVVVDIAGVAERSITAIRADADLMLDDARSAVHAQGHLMMYAARPTASPSVSGSPSGPSSGPAGPDPTAPREPIELIDLGDGPVYVKGPGVGTSDQPWVEADGPDEGTVTGSLGEVELPGLINSVLVDPRPYLSATAVEGVQLYTVEPLWGYGIKPNTKPDLQIQGVCVREYCQLQGPLGDWLATNQPDWRSVDVKFRVAPDGSPRSMFIAFAFDPDATGLRLLTLDVVFLQSGAQLSVAAPDPDQVAAA